MLPFLSRISQQVTAFDKDLLPLKAMSRLVAFPDSITSFSNQERALEDFESSSFDLVCALDVLEHVDDISQTMRQLHRIIMPGGVFVISGPTENIVYKLGRKIAGRHYQGDYHVRDIYEVRRELVKYAVIEKTITLYYPAPLFKIYYATVATAKKS